MPNYVKVDSKPFHPDTYMGPEHDEDEAVHDSGRETSMSIKLKVENTLRWRWTKDANGQDVSYPSILPSIYPLMKFCLHTCRSENRIAGSSDGPTEPSVCASGRSYLTLASQSTPLPPYRGRPSASSGVRPSLSNLSHSHRHPRLPHLPHLANPKASPTL